MNRIQHIPETEMEHTMNRLTVSGLLIALALSGACATADTSRGDDDDSGAGSGAAPAQTQSAAVTPAEGGTLSDSAGRISLTVPAGAVTSPVTVTLEVDPATADTATPVFHFGPDETTFAVAGTLSVSTEDVTADAGADLVLSRYSDGEWVPVGDAVPGSGGIQAPITQLGSFAVIAVAEPAGPCEASCMSQPGAVCCTSCGCDAEVACEPSCPTADRWDCELGCCFDATAFTCVE